MAAVEVALGAAEGAPPSAMHGQAVVATAAARASAAGPPSRASAAGPATAGGVAGRGAGGEGRGVGNVGAATPRPVAVDAAVAAVRPPPGSRPTPTASNARARPAGVRRAARLATPGPSLAVATRRVTGPVGVPRYAPRRGVAGATFFDAGGSATCAAAMVTAATAADTLGAAGGAGAADSVERRAATTGDGRLAGVEIDEEAAATALASPSSISIPTATVAAAASTNRAGRGRTVRCRRRFFGGWRSPRRRPRRGRPPQRRLGGRWGGHGRRRSGTRRRLGGRQHGGGHH